MYFFTLDLANCCRRIRTSASGAGAVFSRAATSFLPRLSISSPLSANHCFICWTELGFEREVSRRIWAVTLSLEGVGAVLGLEKQKLKEGKDLIRYFCTPAKDRDGNL